MNSPSRGELPFLPKDYTDIVGKFDSVEERLIYPNHDYSSAQAQLALVSKSVASLIDSSTRVLSFDMAPSIGEAVSADGMEDTLVENGLNSVLIDSKHALLIGTAALATGVALSTDNGDTAQHGFELGARIVGQRARLNAQSLMTALLNCRSDLGFDGGGNLLERASRFYDSGRKDMSPLAKVSKSTGRQFDEISLRVYSEENFDRSHVASIDVGRRGQGLLGRIGNRWGAAKAAAKATHKSLDPVTTTELVEELFDTYLGYPVLKMEDRETLLVANFAQKVQRYYEIAGRSIPEVQQDSRAKHLGLLVGRLGGMDVTKAVSAYKKIAHNVSREASDS
jgi:hypothetical protein